MDHIGAILNANTKRTTILDLTATSGLPLKSRYNW